MASKWQSCDLPTMCQALCSVPATHKSILKATTPSTVHEACMTQLTRCKGDQSSLFARDREGSWRVALSAERPGKAGKPGVNQDELVTLPQSVSAADCKRTHLSAHLITIGACLSENPSFVEGRVELAWLDQTGQVETCRATKPGQRARFPSQAQKKTPELSLRVGGPSFSRVTF